MRPRGMPSTRVKILPWYYTYRNPPTRAEELRKAIEFDRTANESPHPVTESPG